MALPAAPSNSPVARCTCREWREPTEAESETGRLGGSGIMDRMSGYSAYEWVVVASYENVSGRPNPLAAVRG